MLSVDSIKALAQAVLITQVGAGCVGFCEENLLAKQSETQPHSQRDPGNEVVRNNHLKKLPETMFTTKMATTLDHVTGA